MMEKQQTAVEWLMEQITYEDDGKRFISFIECTDLTEFFTKAKQIEREQIENGYNQGYRDGESDGWMNGDKDISNYSNANQYYTQTYGQ